MTALVIEQGGEIREAFNYERPLMETTHHTLLEYARATYGADAKVRLMTEQEEVEFTTQGSEFFRKHMSLARHR